MEDDSPPGRVALSSPDTRVLGPGHYSLLVDGRSYEVFVREGREGFLVEIDGHLIPVRPETGAEAKGAEKAGPAVIGSPMPGRVIGIKVVEGETVERGEGVLIVEAMKMENELAAPKSGKVVKIAVKVGDAVETGEELVIIE